MTAFDTDMFGMAVVCYSNHHFQVESTDVRAQICMTSCFICLIASRVMKLLQFQLFWAIYTMSHVYTYICTYMYSPKHHLQKPPFSQGHLPHYQLSTTAFQIQETLCAIDLQSAKVKMTGLSRWSCTTPMSGSSDATNLSSGGTGGTFTQTTHCSST